MADSNAAASLPFISFNDFFKELVKFGVKRGHVTLTDDNAKANAEKDYNLLREAIKGKNKDKARQFLADFGKDFGFEPLSKPGGRAFWSGQQGKRMAIHMQNGRHTDRVASFQAGPDGKYTALEGSDFGSFFDQMQLGPFEESVTLWSVISEEFAKGAQGDVVMFATEGLACHKVFWDSEVEEMRKRQREGKVKKIIIYASRPTSADDETFRNSTHPDAKGQEEAKLWVQIAELLPGEQCVRIPITFDRSLGEDRFEGIDKKTGKIIKWVNPKMINPMDKRGYEYDPKKLARFVDFLLPYARGDYSTARGYLYGYGKTVLSGVRKKLAAYSALERTVGGTKVLLAEYNSFLIKEVYYTQMGGGEFMQEAFVDLDRYLEATFQNFAQLPDRMAVVSDAIIFKPKDKGNLAIQAIRPIPERGFRSIADLLKNKKQLNSSTRPLSDLLELRRYGVGTDVPTLYLSRLGVAKAVADIRAMLGLNAA